MSALRRSAAWIPALCALALLPCARCVRAGTLVGSALALPRLEPATPAVQGAAAPAEFTIVLEPAEVPQLVLAQRTITREWGESDDSVYVDVDVPGYRSEGWAAAASLVVPGSGQLYSGDSGGLWFALAEVVGWSSRYIFHGKSDDLRSDAEAFAGNPADSASTWSFDRWEDNTQADAAPLRELYTADPDAFYHRIANDPSYGPGWVAEASRVEYKNTYDDSQRYLKRARSTSNLILLNHVVAAFDALRAARLHNVALGGGTQLQLRSSWHRGPSAQLTLLRRF